MTWKRRRAVNAGAVLRRLMLGFAVWAFAAAPAAWGQPLVPPAAVLAARDDKALQVSVGGTTLVLERPKRGSPRLSAAFVEGPPAHLRPVLFSAQVSQADWARLYGKAERLLAEWRDPARQAAVADVVCEGPPPTSIEMIEGGAVTQAGDCMFDGFDSLGDELASMAVRGLSGCAAYTGFDDQDFAHKDASRLHRCALGSGDRAAAMSVLSITDRDPDLAEYASSNVVVNWSDEKRIVGSHDFATFWRGIGAAFEVSAATGETADRVRLRGMMCSFQAHLAPTLHAAYLQIWVRQGNGWRMARLDVRRLTPLPQNHTYACE